MTPQQLISQYPLLYHMAELGSWPSIQQHGLLSASALLDLFEIQGSERIQLESRWRPGSVHLNHPKHGSAVIRDQLPMPEDKLSALLTGATTREWYELINRKTFFWVDTRRLAWMLKAPPYRNKTHCVLTVRTRALLDRHLDAVTLSDQNSGSLYSGKFRGPDTFRQVSAYRSRWIAELAVDYSVPDVADFTLRVEERRRDNTPRLIWEPS